VLHPSTTPIVLIVLAVIFTIFLICDAVTHQYVSEALDLLVCCLLLNDLRKMV
jgi:hypothetical protein